ncbi:hypothetical protein WJX72_009912 [[Myrmecia] bisecta]|uniref:Cyclic nucleotide-binding domain-containing protein n=1 Tax=[Myrmecia] bisecta TaxID=41462 RepID=A0AAW1Q669_9CHLO
MGAPASAAGDPKQQPLPFLGRTTTLALLAADNRLTVDGVTADVASRKRSIEELLSIEPAHRTKAELDSIESTLTNLVKWGGKLPRAIRFELCKYMRYKAFRSGDVIFRQGDPGSEFYIIISGAVDVIVKDEATGDEKTVAHLFTGDSFGELALLQGHRQRRATCVCPQRSEFFITQVEDYKRVLAPLQQGNMQARIELLKQVPEFAGMSDQMLEGFGCVLTERTYSAREVILYQGQDVEDIVFVLSGGVKLVREMQWGTALTNLSKALSVLPNWLLSPRAVPIKEDKTAAARMRLKNHHTSTLVRDALAQHRAEKTGRSPQESDPSMENAQPEEDSSPKKRTARAFTTYASMPGGRAVGDQALLRTTTTINHDIVQQLEFTGTMEFPDRLFLEVDLAGKGSFFGEASVIKPSTQQTTVIATQTTRVLVLNKWDLVKRANKDLMDKLIDRAYFQIINDDSMRSKYIESLQWHKFRKDMDAKHMLDKKKRY